MALGVSPYFSSRPAPRQVLWPTSGHLSLCHYASLPPRIRPFHLGLGHTSVCSYGQPSREQWGLRTWDMSGSWDLEEKASICEPWVREGGTVWSHFNEMSLFITRETPGDTAHHFRPHGARLRVTPRASPALPRRVTAGLVGYPVRVSYRCPGAFSKVYT